MAASPPRIGTRILLSGYIGTIKFVGPVHGTAGTWLGVEWDDPQRGKHDGAKDGVQYFVCTWVVCGSVACLSHRFHAFSQGLKGRIVHSADTLYQIRDNLHTSSSLEIR